MPDGGKVNAQRCSGLAFTRAQLAFTLYEDHQLRAQPSYSLCRLYFAQPLLIQSFHCKTNFREVISLLETFLQKLTRSISEVIQSLKFICSSFFIHYQQCCFLLREMQNVGINVDFSQDAVNDKNLMTNNILYHFSQYVCSFKHLCLK